MRAGSYGAVYDFVPQTFLLPNEYVAFMREYAEQKEPSIWICKPSDSSRGRGIFLISDMSQLIYDQQVCFGDSSRGRGIFLISDMSQLIYDQQYVIQQYIKTPLLIAGFKFDIRMYVMITSFHPMR
ncbi:tubulin-tyrosine ligase family-domain-containing protein, partial [Baffinella frigidus]